MVMLPACSLYSLLPLSSPGLRRPEQSAFISCCARSWERCWHWEQCSRNLPEFRDQKNLPSWPTHFAWQYTETKQSFL